MRQEIKVRRRRQILDAAATIFAKNGYDKTSMEDIRAASELSKGTLYLYFDSKEALFAAVIVDVFDELLAHLEQRVADNHAAIASDQLQHFLLGLNQILQRNDKRSGLFADAFVQAWQSEIVQQVLRNAYDRHIARLERLIQRGIDAGEFHAVNVEASARLIIATLDGIMLQKLLDPASDITPTLDQLVTMVMTSLRVGALT